MSILRTYPSRHVQAGAAGSLVILVVLTALITLIADQAARTTLLDILEPFFNLAATAALFVAALRSWRRSHRLGLAWGLLAAGMFAYFLGDLTWGVLEAGLGINPFPSIADVFYLAYYPLFVIGLLALPARWQSRTGWVQRIMDLSIALISSLLLFWNFVIGPVALQESDSALLTALSVAYPACDLLLLWAILLLLYRSDPDQPRAPIVLLMLGAGLQVFTDTLFSLLSLTGDYASGSHLELGWIAAFLVCALAGIWQATLPPATASRPAPALPGHFDLPAYLPYIWVILGLTLPALNNAHPLPMSFELLMVSITLVVALVLMRQIITLAENSRLTRQLQAQTDQLSAANLNLQEEINQRRRMETQMAHDALHDGLTRLANRVLFMDRLGQAIEHTHRRSNYRSAVLFLDLDHFKVINESMGHLTGDQLLVSVAVRLKELVRAGDTVARLGGDEFAVLLENTPGDQTTQYVSNRILEEFALPFPLEGQEVFVTASMGVVNELLEYENPEDVLRDADIAMYQAKSQGKARIQIFNTSMRTSAMARMKLENELRQALDFKEFELFYQPIFRLADETLLGFEALLRWNHPQRGRVTPNEFIRVAEETGLIERIGKWVLEEGCAQMQRWRRRYPNIRPPVININLSGRQFAQSGLVLQIQQLLQDTNLEPSALKLEVTESVLIDNPSLASDIFRRVNQLGVQFQLDDFGTGYSSLSYLQHFPLQAVKIDRSFVQTMVENERSRELIRTIILMAKNLKMVTTAEGVETAEQLNALRELGCDHVQGYLFARPLPRASAEELLAKAAKAG